jgi:hypothetical protein
MILRHSYKFVLQSIFHSLNYTHILSIECQTLTMISDLAAVTFVPIVT